MHTVHAMYCWRYSCSVDISTYVSKQWRAHKLDLIDSRECNKKGE